MTLDLGADKIFRGMKWKIIKKYIYTARFAFPVYKNSNEIEKDNIYRIEMLIRHGLLEL